MGSTAITANSSGSRVAELRYYPYGSTRYNTNNQLTTYRFTGQRLVAGTGLYFYGARWYDPALGRFIQPDPLVPEPGNPQALNRYAYVYNNPLRYTDPSGHVGCAPEDQACWVNEWNWKNRWYNAHGYFWGGNHWSVVGDPQFQDEGITDDVIAEAGISLASTVSPSPWSWANKQKVAYAVARFGQKLSGGIAALQALLGGYAVINLNPGIPVYCKGACAPPPPWTGGHDVFFAIGTFGAADLVGGAQWVVHELAHVIDWQNNFSPRWAPYPPLTDYAATKGVPVVYPGRWEKWAEAVTVYVFPDYKINEPRRQRFDPVALQVQMDRMQALLEGWY